MKLLEKITSLFVDEEPEEEEIELEEEPKEEYKEPPKKELPKIMRESIMEEKKEEVVSNIDVKPIAKEQKVETRQTVITEPQRKFNFPIDFDEEVKKAEKREEIPQRRVNNNIENITRKNNINHNVNVLNMEKESTRKTVELYPKKESNIKPKFKASPVISPVYGILDKNYTKEEVKEKNDDSITMKRPSKKVDFETVRKKAFGNLADEIKDNLLCENCELYKEVKKISSLKEDDLLYDMTVESEKEVTIEKAYDNYEEFGVAYEPTKEKKKETEEIEEKDSLINIINENISTDDSKNKDENTFEEQTKDIIIKNNANTNNEEEKISFDNILNEIEEYKEEPKIEDIVEKKEEKIPSRQKNKKEEKVDDDFFELIDSMYKERIDE